MSKELSRVLSISRVLAIISVLSAHINITHFKSLSLFYSQIGTIGVVAFFILSGFFYKEYTIEKILKSKFISIVIPWLIAGVIVYVLNGLLIHERLSILNCLKWIIGYKTYLYFIPMLLICYSLTFYRKTWLLILYILINIMSVYASEFSAVKNVLFRWHITNYLNVFNWCGYFSLGMLARKINTDKMMFFLKKYRLMFVGFFVFIEVVFFAFKVRHTYFSLCGMLFSLLGTLAMISVSSFLIKLYNKLEIVSNYSFSIYLYHMVLIGVVDKIVNHNFFLSLFANMFLLLVMICLFLIADFVSEKLHINKLYHVIIGCRSRIN